MSVKLIIADDHPLFRRGLTDLLKEHDEFEIVAEASNGEEVKAYVDSISADIILLDINMPQSDGFELLSVIRHSHLDTKVIILTMHDEIVFARRAFDLGADGYLLKDDAESLIVECLHEVLAGKQYCSLGDIEQLNSDSDKHEQLSPAEKRVLILVGTGKSSVEIADLLSVSTRTVDNHRAHITTKLGLRGSNALLKYAMQHSSVVAKE